MIFPKRTRVLPAAWAALSVLCLGSVLPATRALAAGTLVLPFRTVGISDTTAAVSLDILTHELRTRGVQVLNTRALVSALPAGMDGCDDPSCAAELGRDHEADQTVYGSLSRLGDKILVQVECLRTGEAGPFYSDRLPALSEDDLDTVLLRIAEGIASRRPNSDRVTVDSVIREEAREPRRRAGRRGIGVRGGFLFPVDGSYGDERLTDLRLVYKFEGRKFLLETTTLLGFTWGKGTVEWNLLDVFAARVFGMGDVSAYVGGGLGVRTLNVERRIPPSTTFPYPMTQSQEATTLSADVGVGLMALRTYDYNLVIELRYHYVFEDFDDLGGHGANGFLLTFGTSR
jgi:hypothetical protein